MASLNINGASLEYSEEGHGEPLVFVHGSDSDYRTWHHQKESFSRFFRSIVYSRRYHWPNDEISEGTDYSMIEHVKDLQALLQSLNIPPVHPVGHSYGAFLSLVLAIRKPNLISTIVLSEPKVITLFVSTTPTPMEILKLLVIRPRTAAGHYKIRSKGCSPCE